MGKRLPADGSSVTDKLVAKAKLARLIRRDRDLPAFARLVGEDLIDRFNFDRPADFQPRLELLASELGCDEKTIRRAIAALKERGYFTVERERAPRGQNLYFPNFDVAGREPMPAPEGEVAAPNRTPVSSQGGCAQSNARQTGHLCPSKPDTAVPANRTPESSIKGDLFIEDRSQVFGAACSVAQEVDRPHPRTADQERQSFAEFWGVYPWPIGEGTARNAFVTIIRSGEATASDLLAAAIEMSVVLGDDGRNSCPDPTSWLNNRQWQAWLPNQPWHQERQPE